MKNHQSASLNALRRDLREIGGRLESVYTTPAGRFIPLRRLSSAIKQIDKALAESIPTKMCPYCNGRGCKPCHSTGKVPKILYDTAPEELKK